VLQKISHEFVEDITYLLYGLIAGLTMAFALLCWVYRSAKTKNEQQLNASVGQI